MGGRRVANEWPPNDHRAAAPERRAEEDDLRALQSSEEPEELVGLHGEGAAADFSRLRGVLAQPLAQARDREWQDIEDFEGFGQGIAGRGLSREVGEL